MEVVGAFCVSIRFKHVPVFAVVCLGFQKNAMVLLRNDITLSVFVCDDRFYALI